MMNCLRSDAGSRIRSLVSDARGAIYVEFLVAFLPTFTFFVALLQIGLLYTTHIFVEHAATIAARTAALSLANVPATGTVGISGESEKRVRAAALLALAPLVMDGSLNTVNVKTGDATTTSYQPMTAEHVDMLRTRVEVVVRCKIPIGGRVACGLGGGSGFGLDPSIPIAAESVFPVQLARAESARCGPPPETVGPGYGTNNGRPAASERCNSVSGFSGRSGKKLDSISLTCDDGGSTSATPTNGGGGGSAFSERCPAGTVAVGVAGRAGKVVDQFSLICEDGFGSRSSTSKKGGGGGSPFEYSCPQGSKLVGLNVQSGKYVDKIEPVCK